jgi:hypothetical protein
MASDNTELRGIVSADLAQALDAIAMAKGLNRHAYVVSILDAEVKRWVREASMGTRVLRGNTYLTDAEGGRTE